MLGTPHVCMMLTEILLLFIGISDELAHALSHSNSRLVVTSQVLMEVTRKAVAKCPNIKVHRHKYTEPETTTLILTLTQTKIHMRTDSKERIGICMIVLKHLFLLKQNIF